MTILRRKAIKFLGHSIDIAGQSDKPVGQVPFHSDHPYVSKYSYTWIHARRYVHTDMACCPMSWFLDVQMTPEDLAFRNSAFPGEPNTSWETYFKGSFETLRQCVLHENVDMTQLFSPLSDYPQTITREGGPHLNESFRFFLGTNMKQHFDKTLVYLFAYVLHYLFTFACFHLHMHVYVMELHWLQKFW